MMVVSDWKATNTGQETALTCDEGLLTKSRTSAGAGSKN